jgi:PAS domain S-box-containing protein
MESAAIAVNRQLFGILFDHCCEGVFAVQRDSGCILTANHRFSELSGRPLDELIGSGAAELFAHRMGSIFERPGLHEDVALTRPDGYPLFVTMTVAHLDQTEHGPLAACIARDTTERQLLERELLAKHMGLHAAQAELERAVTALGERNREMAVLGAQLSNASRRALIGELSAGIAHSLNNPLAALASTHKQIVAAVENFGSSELAQQVQRFAKRSRDAIARMEQTVNAVKTTHKYGSTSTEARLLKLDKEVELALALFEARLKGIRVVKEFCAEPSGHLSPGDLQHVLWNLIDNAILAMPDGGQLNIDIERRENFLIIAIGDSGPGIAPTQRPNLFQPFSSTRSSGTGLGLSTARRLARSWGGDVMLAPSALGARFEIAAPYRAATAS